MKKLITSKLFFSKYDYRVTMNVAHEYRHGENSPYPHPRVVEYLINELQPKQGIRVRHASVYSTKRPSTHTIYFADKRVLELLQERFAGHLLEVMEPLNDNHSEAMAKDKVIVRPKLFYGKYRFCIRTSRRHIPNTYKTTSQHMEEMVRWCKDTFKHKIEKEDYYIYDGWSKNFFFANAADCLLMKMTFGEDIDRTERIMLIDEVPPTAE